MYQIAYTQHSGKKYRSQQDAMWTGRQCIQSANSSVEVFALNPPFLLSVADGVAVSPHPHLASKFVVSQLAKYIDRHGLTRQLMQLVHSDLCQRYARGSTCGSSTTVVAAYVTETSTHVMNIGDSRAYLFDAQSMLQQLSRDHTILNDMGDDDFDDDVEYASVYNALSDCLIADPEEHAFSVHENKTTLQIGDTLLLCSDGVHDTLGNQWLEKLFNPTHSIAQQTEIWRKAVLDAGAPDNFSLVVTRRCV